MPDLQTLANLAEVLGAATVIGGAFFAVGQLREARRVRRSAVASELMRSFYSAELARAISLIEELPEGLGVEEIRRRGREVEAAAFLIGTTYETMGLLVYRRIASFDLVYELTGGISRVLWHRLAHWIEETRTRNEQPSFAEWYQWLVERFDEYESKDPIEPAYVRAAAWKPRSD